MIVRSEKTLKLFRGPGICECGCGIWSAHCEANHVLQRGIGGGSRLDVPENLIRLRPQPCHGAYHDGRPGFEGHNVQQQRFFDIIAIREGYPSGQAVREYLDLILRTPKEGPLPSKADFLAARSP